MSKQTTRRYTPRGALCSLRRLKLFMERVKRRRKSETLYAVASTKDVGTVFYYLCLDETAKLLDGYLRIDCKRIGQSDKLSPGTFNLKIWNVTSTNKPYPFFLFENYFYALAYKLQCDHDQQTGS